jgi:hypothetical protein
MVIVEHVRRVALSLTTVRESIPDDRPGRAGAEIGECCPHLSGTAAVPMVE